MDARTLLKLRVAFVLLGATLLSALFLLVNVARARLEAQRQLRHQIVAERIFDEMERELNLLLEGEGARPSSAYDAPRTRAETWAPFVVGYFTGDADGVHLVAREQLAAARAGQVEHAAQACWKKSASERVPARADDDKAGAADAKDAEALDKNGQEAAAEVRASAKPDAILRKLNRSAAQRPKQKSSAAKSQRDDYMDPLGGLE